MKPLTFAEAKQLAYDAFIYGYPVADNYRVMFKGAVLSRQGLNQFHGEPRTYTSDDRVVVLPNNDTAYSTAYLSLRNGPILLEVPPIADRYWSFQLIDTFTNNLPYIGSRTKGSAGGRYFFVGPSWKGATPADATLVRLPGESLFLLGRTEIKDSSEVEKMAVKAIMESYKLKRQKPHTHEWISAEEAAPADLPYADEASIKLARYFFPILNHCLTHCQGPQDSPVDRALMERLAAIGVGPKKTFKPEVLGDELMNAMEAGIAEADAQIETWARGNVGFGGNGWSMLDPKAVLFGKDADAYNQRAQVCRAGIYANSPEEALYPLTAVDNDRKALQGTNRYRITFPAGLTPEVNEAQGGFWSITMYDDDRFLVANDIKVYSVGDRSNLNQNGEKTTIAIQVDKPDETEDVIWLPAPKGNFMLCARVYCPGDSVIASGEGDAFFLPAVERL